MAQLDDLAWFCAVAEAGSFSVAAQRLEVTTSAVSKAVGRLERRLGAKLLHRSTRRLRLTEAGGAYYAHARRAVEEAAAAADAVAALGGAPRGKLRVSAPMTMGLALLARLIPAFLDRHPGLAIDLELDDRRVDLIAGGFDLAIRVGELDDSGFLAKPVGTMPAVPVAAPAYLETHGEPQRPEDLAGHACLLYSYHFGGHEWRFDGPDGRRHVRLSGRYTVNSSMALREAALAGLGIARIPAYLVRDDILDGRLRRLLPGHAMDRATIHAVMPTRDYVPAKVRLLIDFLSRHLDATRMDLPTD